MTSRPSAGYVPSINGFRGACVMLVFLHHVANSGLPPEPAADSPWQTGLHQVFMSFGYGVELFFMISGYVIVLSLRRHASIGEFLKDRALRIFPVWVPLVICLTIAGTLGGWRAFAHIEPMRWWATVVGNLLLLPPLVPLPLVHPASWSLTYEWVFYFLAALGALLSRRSTSTRPALVVWMAAAALLMACFPRSLYFLPGVLVAFAPQISDRFARTAWLAWVSLPVFLIAWYGTGVFAAQFSTPLWQVIGDGHALGVVVALLAATHLFMCVANPDSRGLGVLRSTAMQKLGTVSYSFYLVHPIAMFAVKKQVVHWMPGANGSWSATLVFALVSALVAGVMSYLSWRWLEQGLARWLKARWRGDAPVRRPEAGPATKQA